MLIDAGNYQSNCGCGHSSSRVPQKNGGLLSVPGYLRSHDAYGINMCQQHPQIVMTSPKMTVYIPKVVMAYSWFMVFVH